MTDQLIAQKLLAAAQVVEKQLDAEIERLDQLDDDDLEVIRQRRVAEMKAASKKRQEQEAAGHGKVTELVEEPEFFVIGKKSEKLVVHFSDPLNRRCEHVDYCFEKLAPAHFGTKFVKINRERIPYLLKRLNIQCIPSVCVILDNVIVNYLRIENAVGGKTDEQTLLAHIEKWLLNENAIEKLVVTRGSKPKN